MAIDMILTNPLHTHIGEAIHRAGGWMPFDGFMAMALYTSGLGYYANASPKFGILPDGSEGAGGDFATAPEMTSLFGRTLARQVAQALAATSTSQIWEFGAGTGALALQILQALDLQHCAWERYTIVDVSGSLRGRQQTLLAPYGDKVEWINALPDSFSGVVVGNEVLDAMPVKLLARTDGAWFERGVAVDLPSGQFVWRDRPTVLRPSAEIPGSHPYLTEIHPQAEAFVRTLADRLHRGAAFFIDYGFPESEYYLPQRHMGTVMCHQAHRADSDPLVQVGLKDITAHVNFSGLAVAAQEAGFEVLGYTSQARFLMNCGLLAMLETASWADKAMAQKLLLEHEMGELFKVIGLHKPGSQNASADWLAMGFAQGDRSHRL